MLDVIKTPPPFKLKYNTFSICYLMMNAWHINLKF